MVLGSLQDNAQGTFVDSPTRPLKTAVETVVGSSALPLGAATLAEQLIQSATLINIDSKLNTLGQKTMALSVPVTLASDQTKIPFYLTETVDETYSVLALGVTFALNKSMISVLNSSSKVLKIKSVKMINNQSSNVSGVVVDFRFKRITGFTGGTALIPETFDLNDTLLGVTAATGATVSGEATGDLLHYNWSNDEWGVKSANVESNDHTAQSLIPVYETRNGLKSITLRNGQGLTIKNVTNTAVSNFDFEMIFTLGDT